MPIPLLVVEGGGDKNWNEQVVENSSAAEMI